MTSLNTRMANAIRALSMDAVQRANCGHPGMPMGMADVATALVTKHLSFVAEDAKWPNRDRLILSAGHGSMLLYSLLYLTGAPDISIEDIKNFRQLGSKTAGHPEYGLLRGIETTTGPLGQGLANAVGMALAERIMADRFGGDLFNHYTYAIAGDGCLMEGISQEAITLAGHLNLSKLIVLFDDNGISIDGPVSLTDSTDQLARFRAAGWAVREVDGHDQAAVDRALTEAKQHKAPTLIACKTVIGFGAPNKSGTAAVHGAALGADEVTAARKELGWTSPPFEIPDDILSAWRKAGCRAKADADAWRDRLAAKPQDLQTELKRVLGGELPPVFSDIVASHCRALAENPAAVATRKASENMLTALAPHFPEFVGGSADLTGSNNTKTKDEGPIRPGDFSGRYVYYGIREHAMAAIMNGMALYGGIIPYGGTFLVFTDYCRPSIRLSALMEQRVIYVMTHDSIGLGEDGPTHQPVEHLASLRAIPNLNVFRPADAMETTECWALALQHKATPSVLSLTRQSVPAVRLSYTEENLCARGGYELLPATGMAQVTLLATGSEVSLAVEAQSRLEQDGIGTRVVSLPCWELFDSQPEEYRNTVLGNTPVRIAVEAAVDLGWQKYLRNQDTFIGMHSFGTSAPCKEAYRHFGITVDAIIERAKFSLG